MARRIVVDRSVASAPSLVPCFRDTRDRTRRLFDLVAPEAYETRPIPLRHPIVFYEGHIPAFAVNTLVKKALGQPGIDAGLERLFARGIDPEDEARAAASAPPAWPSRETVHAYVGEADRLVLGVLASVDLDREDARGSHLSQAVHTVLEHELMHQETLLYIFHRLPYGAKRAPAGVRALPTAGAPKAATVRIPAGPALLGADPARTVFGWDNEFPAHTVDVPAFDIDIHDVTNAQYLEFVDAGGYRDVRWWEPEAWRWIETEDIRHPLFWERHGSAWAWRGMFELIPLPAAWPVYVSHAEATAYARWRGALLPSEAEFHRAAYGTPSGAERRHPWGEEWPDATRGNFDFRHWDPVPAGSFPEGRSAWGVEDLVGNGWEWTRTVFAPFPGFAPMWAYPEYSADFFDGQHYVIKGASPATAAPLVRRSLRNWFRAQYPYAYATFRCVRPVAGAAGR